MSAPVPSTRRLAIAIGAAATSATVAIGVTAASLLGWFRPPDQASEVAPAPTPARSPVILVPVAPTPPSQPATDPNDVQLAMNDTGPGRSYAHDDDDDGDHDRRDHHDEEEGDDDD